jgi:uncharacterized Zn finger protein
MTRETLRGPSCGPSQFARMVREAAPLAADEYAARCPSCGHEVTFKLAMTVGRQRYWKCGRCGTLRRTVTP